MHVYFLGIGGAGIGPLAQIALSAGYKVSGSDKQNTSYIDYLKSKGLTDITIGDSPEIIKDTHSKKPIDWVVYSSAVAMEDSGRAQLDFIKSQGIKATRRDEFISNFTQEHNLKMIAVAGTHGKTTTTAMLVWLFLKLNQSVSYLLPAKVSYGEMGLYNNQSQYFIYEADEYDRNFLAFSPRLSLISGVSWDHHEVYLTRQEYIEAFRQFISQSDEVVIWSSDAKYLGVNDQQLLLQSDDLPELNTIHLKGLYNRRDGWLAVVGLSKLLNISSEELISHLNDFPGLSRRMEEIYPGLYSDYAHTPDKIKGAISAASEIASEKDQQLVVVYEPLTNRRQVHMIDDYRDCFKGASHVYWLPSYLAREDPQEPVIRPEKLISRLSDPSIAEVANRDNELADKIRDHLTKGHMVVAMAGGGGDSLDDWLRANFKTDH